MAQTGPTEILFAQADRLLGSTETNQRLTAAIDAGADLGATAARLVECRYPFGHEPRIVGFDAAGFVYRVGQDRVMTGLPAEDPDPASPQPGGWASRRAYALAELVRALPQEGELPMFFPRVQPAPPRGGDPAG